MELLVSHHSPKFFSQASTNHSIYLQLQNTNKPKMLQNNELKTIENINRLTTALDTKITFEFNESIEALSVNVIETKSGLLIRKVPVDEVVRLAEYYQEIYGIIFDRKS